MNKEDFELMKAFDAAENNLEKAQHACDSAREQLQIRGLLSFKEFFKPYVGKCFKKQYAASPFYVYIKILEHRYSTCFKIIKFDYMMMETEETFLKDFPELYTEISNEEFMQEAVKWFTEHISQHD